MSDLRADLAFFLYDWLDAASLCARPRFASQDRATWDEVLRTCERIARERFAPHNRLVDTREPALVDVDLGGDRHTVQGAERLAPRQPVDHQRLPDNVPDCHSRIQ